MSVWDWYTFFKTGVRVEISTDEEGFRGAWFLGVVIRPPTRMGLVVVEYETLMSEEDETKPLQEIVEVVKIRPVPPREPTTTRAFVQGEEVDAYHSEGWWEGIVIEAFKETNRYDVYFRCTGEQIDFDRADLRLHREWINGYWRPAIEEGENGEAQGQVMTMKDKEKPSLELAGGDLSNGGKEEVAVLNFSKGSLVEVSSHEVGFRGAWLAATVIEALDNGKYLIEYLHLKIENEDGAEYLRDEVEPLHVRPWPDYLAADNFSLYDEVDALYKDARWIGMISKVLGESKYMVHFIGSKEELEFKHDKLKPHLEWINGKWYSAAKVSKQVEKRLYVSGLMNIS